MKLQRLTSLDINILATELNNELAGSFINSIVYKTNSACFILSTKIIQYYILSGNPYLIKIDSPLEGRNWLPNIKHGRIESVSQRQSDRLLMFEITVFDNLGKRKNYRLYLEFFKNGNIILTDTNGKILTSFRRSVKRGEKYCPVRPPGFNILSCPENYTLMPPDVDMIKSLRLLQYSKLIEETPSEILKYIFQMKKNPEPHILKDNESRIIGFSFYAPPFTSPLIGEKTSNFLEAITLYVKSIITLIPKKTTDYKRRIQKAKKKLKAIEDELAEASKFPTYRLYGEIILANIGNISRSEKSYILTNPYSEHREKIEIAINPALRPKQNAKAYFEKARKFELSIPLLKKRLARQKNEIARLKEIAANPPQVEKTDRAESSGKRVEKIKLPFRHYKLPDGWQIYIGKTATSNDELTFSFAKKDDLWFHAWQATGSHLVLRPPQKGAIPDKNTLLKAASIAAYFSKAKHSAKVPVIYTEARYVRKIKKAAGKVSVSKEKQLMVAPQKPQMVISD
jgi:predicted ribosome quality control (RQC) complex YloA/Tae2 family protein